MSHYEHVSTRDHESRITSLGESIYHDLVSPHPLFDLEIGRVRLCSPGIIHEKKSTPPVHSDIPFGQYFTETIAEVPSSRRRWVSNVSSLPELFSQPYAYQGPERFGTYLWAPIDHLHGDGTSMYTFPILQPSLAGTDSPTATEAEQYQDRSVMEHSSFTHESFPLSTTSHFDLRRALATVMTSPWKLQNDFERHPSTLLQFLEYEKKEKRWHCCFWVRGTHCNCSYSKKDQAKNHIRCHIKHLPFSCNKRGICPKDGVACFRRFCSAEALQKHREPPKNCANCGKVMLKSNLRRHNATACRKRRHSD